MQELGYGGEYKYPHDFPGHFVEQQYLPEQLKNVKFYEPGHNQHEQKLFSRLKNWWKTRYGKG
jgi:putative ATPase